MDLVTTAIRLAFTAIAMNKGRTLLTVLGVFVGISAVIITVSLANAAESAVADQISTGSGVLKVFPDLGAAGGRSKVPPIVTEEDGLAIAREAPHVKRVSSVAFQNVTVVQGERNVRTAILGVGDAYFEASKTAFSRGAPWSETEETLKASVAVIDASLAERLFGEEEAVGRTIRVGRVQFRVVGVAVPTRAGSGDLDDRVYVPLRVLRARIASVRDGRVDFILVIPKSLEDADAAKIETRAILAQRYRARGNGQSDFRVGSEEEELRARAETVAVLSNLFVLVAGVSLLVGGVGVMNIMLVSVAERVREIGIRLAIGAQGADVLLQFLVESVALTLLGGVCGVLGGFVGVAAVGYFLHMTVSVSPMSIVVGAGTSVTIGLVFGFFPALQASRLDPVEAMRAE